MAAAATKALPSVVHVFIEIKESERSFKIERPSSGVIVDPSGLVVTQWSLVKEALDTAGKNLRDRALMIQLSSGQKLPAHFLTKHIPSGLALLRAKFPSKTVLPSIELADSSRLAPGERAAVLSYHDGNSPLAFSGVVAHACGGSTVGSQTLTAKEILLTDAAIQQRSHGGALIDANGRLLGICNAEHVQRAVREPTLTDLKKPTFGFAIPTATFRAAFKKELAGGKSSRKPSPEEIQKPTAAAVAIVASSIVGIWNSKESMPEIGLRDPYSSKRRPGLGSGVIISTNGLVLTNAHLINKATHINVTLNNGRHYTARSLATNRQLNLALLKIDLPKNITLPAIVWADSDKAMLGETVLGIGNPWGDRALTISIGVISARRSQNWLQADPTLGNATAGGALIDLSGRLLGIVDGGVIDKIDRAFRERGDRAKLDSNLSMVASTNSIRRAFAEVLAKHGPLLPTTSPTPLEIKQRRSGITAMMEKSANALINVYVSRSSAQADAEDNPFAPAQPKIRGESLGSGVIIDQSGLALSNWHVVDAATEPDGSMRRDHVVHARLANGKQYPVRVLSISREEDLSLLQLQLPEGSQVDAIELGDSDHLSVGETAIAIGNPHGRANTITAGVVSALDQATNVRNRWAKLRDLIETDAAINPGNSGGALLDLQGRLIGINSAGGGSHSATSYAIAVKRVREKTLGLLLTPEKLRSAYLGMEVRDIDGKLMIDTVSPFGPAIRAGMKKGDRLASMDSIRLTWSVGYVKQLLTKSADREISFEIERDGKRLTRHIRPLDPSAWAVCRQTGLEVKLLSVQTAPTIVRDACITLHREYTGDATAQPGEIMDSLVQVERLLKGLAPDDLELAPGDLLLAIESPPDDAGSSSLIRFKTPEEIQNFVNRNSSYEGRKFRCWIYREKAVRTVSLTAKRLML